MKNIAKILIASFIVLLFTGCYDRDVIDSKYVYDFTMPSVENLDYVKEGNTVKLTWTIPENIPEEFKRPIEVKIQIVENNIYKDLRTVYNENTSIVLDETSLNTNKESRVIVKLFGYIKEDVKKEVRTDNMFSAGQILQIK